MNTYWVEIQTEKHQAEGVNGHGYRVQADDDDSAAILGTAAWYRDWSKYMLEPGGAYQKQIEGGVMCGVRITREEAYAIIASPIKRILVWNENDKKNPNRAARFTF